MLQTELNDRTDLFGYLFRYNTDTDEVCAPDVIKCKSIPVFLIGTTVDWYEQSPTGSIDLCTTLIQEFIKKFQVCRKLPNDVITLRH